jgi:CYTH domain-containing protein
MQAKSVRDTRTAAAACGYTDDMGIEIERKFLVHGDSWREGATGTRYQQGYLAVNPNCSVRVRLGGERAWLTIKGGREGLSREEFEYPLPLADAEALLALCLPGVISKTRYVVTQGKHRWEIDEFHGDNEGLLLAEIELEHEDETFDRPGWLGEEVSNDVRYYNAALSATPYCRWKDRE